MVKLQQIDKELKESISCLNFLIGTGLGDSEEIEAGLKHISELMELNHALTITQNTTLKDLV